MENVLIKNENGYTEENSEQTIKNYYETLPKRTKEYMEFLDFLLEAQGWESELVIIKGEEWDEFYNSSDSEREMNLAGWTQADEFYDKFAEITGTDKWKFETCFVSAKYIDKVYYNTMNLIVNINGVNQRYIIDIV